MGSYCNSTCLRASAAHLDVHMVVIDSRDASKYKGTPQYQKPSDMVVVYLPGSNKKGIAKYKSWSNDVVPVLLRAQNGETLPADPKFRVIVHNGELAGSWAGHFDATADQ